LERAALDDPFLADALEGMEVRRSMTGQPAFRRDMSELQQRLENRVAPPKNTGKVRLLPLAVRYAAALVLLLGLGLTAYYTFFNQKTKAPQLVKTDKQTAPVTASGPPTSTPAVSPTDSTTIVLQDGHEVAIEKPRITPPPGGEVAGRQATGAASSEAEGALNKQSEQVAKDKEARNDAVATLDQRALSNRALSNNIYRLQPGAPSYSNTSNFSPARPAMTDSLYFDKDSLHFNFNRVAVSDRDLAFKKTLPIVIRGNAVGVQGQEANRAKDQVVLTGFVIDQHNKPLSGAYLTLQNNQNISTVTDKNGFFNFQLPKKDTTAAVVVNYVGYEQQYMTLNTENKKSNIIQLQPQPNSLNEVVIVGYGAKRREILRPNIDAKQKALSLVAVPADGWPAYNNYLSLNMKQTDVDSTLRGDETISFIVNRKGALSSFKVEQSLSPSHDSASLRLIREGPSWKLLSGKKARARVILTW